MSVTIERAQKEDLANIVKIYNWAILNTSATFDTEVKTVDSQLDWFNSHDDLHPIIVANLDSKIVGWGAISKWSERKAYLGTGEVSLYIDPDYHGQGIGSEILAHLIKFAQNNSYRTLISKLAGSSHASIHIHRKLGFADIGTMKNVGNKFGEILDVHLMQLLF